MKTILLTVILSTLLFSISFATTINVPAEYPSIQAGINAALDGDTVLVADSTYYENINFKGKTITVVSHFLMDGNSTHIDSRIIDGSQSSNPDSASVVLFTSGEDSNSVICGFTLKGGYGTKTGWPWIGYVNTGGGIYCINSSPSILNSTITGNGNSGGFIKGMYAKPYFLNVRIINNNSNGYFGSGIQFHDGCAPNFKNVEISYNTGGNGGGIYCMQSDPNLSNVSVHHNLAHELGGGIYFYESTPYFDPVNRCNIFLNLARISD